MMHNTRGAYCPPVSIALITFSVRLSDNLWQSESLTYFVVVVSAEVPACIYLGVYSGLNRD